MNEVIGKECHVGDFRRKYMNKERFFDNHYAIIYDSVAELQNFIDSPHMFLTYFENEGITEKQCEEIIKFLNEEKL